MHGDSLEANDLQPDSGTEYAERLPREIKKVRGWMDLAPVQTLEPRQPRAEVAGGQEKVTALPKQLRRSFDDLTRIWEMFDGVPKAHCIEGFVEPQTGQVPFPHVQSPRLRMRDAGGRNVHTDRGRVILLDQFEKEAVGAADFKDAAAGRHVVAHDLRMVPQR